MPPCAAIYASAASWRPEAVRPTRQHLVVIASWTSRYNLLISLLLVSPAVSKDATGVLLDDLVRQRPLHPNPCQERPLNTERLLEGPELAAALAELCRSKAAATLTIPGIGALNSHFLESMPRTLILEQPFHDGRVVPLDKGATLILRCTIPEGTLEQDMLVRGCRRAASLNDPSELVLEAPTSFRFVQRRTAARTPSAPPLPEVVLLTEGGSVSGLTAELVNLSESGCNLSMDGLVAGALSVHTTIIIRLGLPDDPATVLDLHGQIVRVAAKNGRGSLGVQFVFGTAIASDLQGHIARYLVRAQRFGAKSQGG